MEKHEIAATIAKMGLTVESVFIPFSRSRNKANKLPSLNWRVTVKRADREVMVTDYSAGCGHCPAKASKAPSTYQARDRVRYDGKPWPGTTSMYRAPTEAEKLSDYLAAWRAAECESGLAMEHSAFVGEPCFKVKRVRNAGETQSRMLPILPDPVDVIYSLIMDSSVLDAGGFENWAADYGYDTDSRQAMATYRACLDIALKLRGTIGDSGVQELQTAFQDY